VRLPASSGRDRLRNSLLLGNRGALSWAFGAGLRLQVAESLVRHLVEVEVEDLGQRVERVRPDFVDRDGSPELAGDRRELRVLDPTGRDPLSKRRRVEVDIEGVSMQIPVRPSIRVVSSPNSASVRISASSRSRQYFLTSCPCLVRSKIG